jgi:heme-degrading monooxygenase HmoA
MSSQHLAQLNIGRLVAPDDDPQVAEFMAALDPINALADASPGFVWRLQDDTGNATSIQAFDDASIIVNLSVWESLADLRAFVYATEHKRYLARRREWFQAFDALFVVLWHVPAGHIPATAEARERLAHLEAHGPTPHAFTFREGL